MKAQGGIEIVILPRGWRRRAGLVAALWLSVLVVVMVVGAVFAGYVIANWR